MPAYSNPHTVKDTVVERLHKTVANFVSTGKWKRLGSTIGPDSLGYFYQQVERIEDASNSCR